MIPDLPALVLGLWCGAVRWDFDNSFLIYSSRSNCFAGDTFLQLDKRQLQSPFATCNVTKVEQLGTRRWLASHEMAYAVWSNCKDLQTTWEQKVTLLENGYLKAHSNWVLYEPKFTGRGRSLLQW